VRGAGGARALLIAVVGLAACERDPAAEAKETTAIVPLAPAGAPATLFPAPARRVAPIIAAQWASEATRDAAGEADSVMRVLDIRPGTRVADVGAGSGYYTVRIARRVGPEGHVYAQDVVPQYLAELAERVRRERLTNVTVSLGDPHDPRLPPGSVDVALLVHMYHEVEEPFGLLHNLAPAIRPGGRVAIVDLDRDTWAHGTPRLLLACEMALAGYVEREFRRLPEGAYVAVFDAPAPQARPAPGRIDPRRCAT
jgi:SAM-dependent methyltransferase